MGDTTKDIMAHTYWSLFYHFIWSTKNRLPLIKPSFRNRLYNYIGGIIKNENCSLIAIGGIPNHIHTLISTPAHQVIANLTRIIKTNSSKFINNEIEHIKFAWQNGYGVFSASPSQLNTVKCYISEQEKHHQKMSFQEEFELFLQKHNIPFDSKYLFH